MPQAEWFARFAGLFAENGYGRPPVEIYASFLEVVDRPGRALELGCGNGLLLRFLRDHSPHELLCSGVDLNATAIRSAQTAVFPERAAAFQVGDACQHELSGDHALIIANPLYADRGYLEQRGGLIQHLYTDGSIARYARRCFSALAPRGRLVLFCYRGQLGEIAPFRAAFDRELSAVPVREVPSASGAVTFFLADRE